MHKSRRPPRGDGEGTRELATPVALAASAGLAGCASDPEPTRYAFDAGDVREVRWENASLPAPASGSGAGKHASPP